MHLLQPLLVGLLVNEVKRVIRLQLLIEFFKDSIVVEMIQPLARRNLEMEIALGANVEIGFKLLFPNRLFTILAFCPEPFGSDRPISDRNNWSFALFEPSHTQPISCPATADDSLA
jgi:hypothetical protein